MGDANLFAVKDRPRVPKAGPADSAPAECHQDLVEERDPNDFGT